MPSSCRRGAMRRVDDRQDARTGCPAGGWRVHGAQPSVEGRGHADGVRLGQLGPLAREQLVDRLGPQGDPALEVRLAQRDLGVQLRVRAERPAAVGPGTEQDRLPERRDPRDVRLEVEPRDVREQEADHRIRERAAVEDPDETLAVGAGADVATVGHAIHDDTPPVDAGDQVGYPGQMTPDHARVRLRRTGGIAGRATEAELDTSDLEPDRAKAVLRALDAAKSAPPAIPRPDAFTYELTIERAGGTRTVTFTDPAPAELAPVLDALSGRSRIVPRDGR
jgi:hypothetical protein